MNFLASFLALSVGKILSDLPGLDATVATTRISVYASLLLLSLLVHEIARDRRIWKDISDSAIPLLLIYLLAVIARFSVPHTMRLFFDEDIYLAMGKEILSGKSCLCASYINGICDFCEAMKWPPLNPMIASLSFLLNTNPRVVFILVSSLSPVFAFLSFGRKEKGIVAGMVVALHPLLVLWNTEFAAESLLSTILLLLVMAISRGMWKGAAYAAALAAYAKTEGILLFPIVALLSGRREWKAWLIASLLTVPAFMHAFHFSRVDSWGSSGEKFSLQHFMDNIGDNLSFLFTGIQQSFRSKQLLHPVLLTFLALLSIPSRRRFVLAFAIPLFMLYTSFYAGSVLYGADVRYMLPIVSVISILSVDGAEWLGRSFGKVVERAGSVFGNEPPRPLRKFRISVAMSGVRKACAFMILLPLAIVVAYSVSNIGTIMQAPSEIGEARDARTYRDFVMSNMDMLRDGNCTVISHVTAIYRWNSVSAVQPWYAKGRMDEVSASGCVVFDYGFWCHIQPYSSDCQDFLDYPNTLIDRSDNGKYKLYRLWV